MAAGHDTFHHVKDSVLFELPFGYHIPLPEIAGFELSKFMVLQVIAGLLILWIFKGLSKRIQSGEPAQGRWWNFWETLAVYIRDQVVRPTIGSGHDHHGGDHHSGDDHAAHSHEQAIAHPADQYLPYVWSCFFYVLFCNLLGAIPSLGSPTGELNVTVPLALVTLSYVVYSGSQITGFAGFWKSLAPPMDLPVLLKVILVPLIWAIEVLGLFIKHGVLAMRLFANIMAGHTVLASVLGFIALSANSGWWYLIAPASIFGQIAIGTLELFFAFLQAYLFAFLTTLFISMAVHPH